MNYEEWKRIKAIRGEDTKKVIRDFELNNPRLATLYEKRHEEEIQKMRQTMNIPDRMARWKRIAN